MRVGGFLLDLPTATRRGGVSGDGNGGSGHLGEIEETLAVTDGGKRKEFP